MSKRLNILVCCGLTSLVMFFSSCKEETIYPEHIVYSLENVGLESFESYTICADVNGNGYAIQSTGVENEVVLSYLSSGSSAWTTLTLDFTRQEIGSHTDGNALKTTQDGSVWLLGPEEVLELRNGEVVNRFSISHLLNSNVGVTRIETYHNEVWLLHYSYGLFKLDRETGETVSFPQPGWSGINTHFTIDPQGNKWITKQNYEHNVITLKNDGTWFTAEDPDSLIGCPECAAWGGQTYEGFIAVDTDNNGDVYLYNYHLFRVVDGTIRNMALPFNVYYDGFKVDNDNRIWVYRYRDEYSTTLLPVSTLYRYNGGVLESAVELTDYFDGNVWPYDMCFDANNNQWVATNEGVLVYNENGVK